MKKLLIILCLFSSPVMAGEYDMKCIKVNDSIQRCENNDYSKRTFYFIRYILEAILLAFLIAILLK